MVVLFGNFTFNMAASHTDQLLALTKLSLTKLYNAPDKLNYAQIYIKGLVKLK